MKSTVDIFRRVYVIILSTELWEEQLVQNFDEKGQEGREVLFLFKKYFGINMKSLASKVDCQACEVVTGP